MLRALCVGVLILASAVNAEEPDDYLIPSVGSAPVALQGGDTIGTYTVSVSSDPVVTIRPAVTDRSRRRVCIQNRGSVTISIGSSTVVASNLWVIGESTNTAVTSEYCTNSSGIIRGAALTNAAAQTVRVIEETQSVP